MRKLMIASVLVSMCSLLLQGSVAQAQRGGYFGGNRIRTFVNSGGYGGYGGYSPYRSYSYYGNGGQNYKQRWRAGQTPYGTQAFYGSEPRNYMLRQNAQMRWSNQGYGYTGVGPTTSYYSPQSYYVAP